TSYSPVCKTCPTSNALMCWPARHDGSIGYRNLRCGDSTSRQTLQGHPTCPSLGERAILVTDLPILEPIVMDTIERYFGLLQRHAPAQQMMEQVFTWDCEPGFAVGHRWQVPAERAEFLEARSVLFDESHEVLQLKNVATQDGKTIQARPRLRFFLRRHEP